MPWLLAAGFVLSGVGAVVFVDVDLKGSWEGLYVVRRGSEFAVTNELLLGNESRVIVGVDGPSPVGNPSVTPEGDRPRLVSELDPQEGSGWVRNLLPGGREWVVTFSRYVDPQGKTPRGLFVGGRPPRLPGNEDTRLLNRSGMAYFDGVRWFHVWCNANEALGTPMGELVIQTVDWEYLGSQVAEGDPRHLIWTSRHRAQLPEGPILVERFAFVRAGDPYLVLAVLLTNEGPTDVHFRYWYGDEPWLGDYGSSQGNVGWTAEGLILHESWVDTGRTPFVGYFDYGNEAIGAPHTFSNMANFLEWHPTTRPNWAYFSNVLAHPPEVGPAVPLHGTERAITLEWGPGVLASQETAYVILAIGLALPGPEGFPEKPRVSFELMSRSLFGS